MTFLALPRIIAGLETFWRDLYVRQITDPEHPDCGGVIHPDWDRPERGPGAEAGLIGASLALGVAQARGLAPESDPAVLRDAAASASSFLVRNLRSTNRLDLVRRHPDDGTANAFALQNIGLPLLLAHELVAADAAWKNALVPVEEFFHRATLGLLRAGFHTPNHRWIVCGALALGGALSPDIDVETEMRLYLAETVDIDEEGFYLERSIGVYDGFVNRSFLLVDEFFPHLGEMARAREAALASLHTDAWLINADGSVETGLSSRQDKGSAAASIVLTESYLYAGLRLGDAQLLQNAETLLAARAAKEMPSPFLASLLLRLGEPPVTPPAPRPPAFHCFPKNGLVRVRDERLDATFFRGDHRLCHIKFGKAELAALKIEQAYFGHGKFLGEKLDVQGETLIFESDGNRWHPYWPGYDLPAGKPVPRDEFYAFGGSGQREWRELPRCTSRVTVTRTDGAFHFHYQTLAGPERTLVQIAADFAPGGLWETDDLLLKPETGQHLHLKNGKGRMRYGSDVLEISPGHYTHSAWEGAVPELPGPNGLVRVLLTFETPIDFTLHIRPVRSAV